MAIGGIVREEVVTGRGAESGLFISGDRSAKVVAESKSDEILYGKESGADRGAGASSFESSVVGAAGNSKGGNQFC